MLWPRCRRSARTAAREGGVMRRLTTALTAMAILSPLSLAGVAPRPGPGGAAPERTATLQGAATADGCVDRFIGTFRLVTIEERDATGKWSQTPSFNSIGYITYSDAGYMGVHIMPKG